MGKFAVLMYMSEFRLRVSSFLLEETRSRITSAHRAPLQVRITGNSLSGRRAVGRSVRLCVFVCACVRVVCECCDPFSFDTVKGLWG